MRISTIVAALALGATPALMSAQATTSTKPETVYVKGYVTGDVPPPGATLRGVTGVIVSTTIIDTTRMSTMTTMPPEKPTLDRKVSHGAGEVAEDASSTGKKAAKDVSNAGKKAGKDASKLAKKAAHGAKEVGSDVKKAVTRKP